MTLVVADAGPVRYLVVLGAIDVLSQIFGSIVIPEYVVSNELRDLGAPPEVQHWAASPPSWVQIRIPTSTGTLPSLHSGESQAIALALELKADAILLDDAAARHEARRSRLG